MFNLSASATRDDLSLIAVVMKSPSSAVRFSEAEKLLNYGFNNFSFKQFAKKGDVLKQINVAKGVADKVNCIYENDSGVLLEKGQDKNVTQEITLDENISAPVYEGQKVGEIKYLLNDQTLDTTNIIAQNDVEKLNIFTMSTHIYNTWFKLLRN